MAQELPKLSGVTQRLKVPEARFESMVKKATGVELPPGPQSVLLKVQRGVEVGKPPAIEEIVPTPPKLEAILERLPELPAESSEFERSGKPGKEEVVEEAGFARY